jgi:hypothetical protein
MVFSPFEHFYATSHLQRKRYWKAYVGYIDTDVIVTVEPSSETVETEETVTVETAGHVVGVVVVLELLVVVLLVLALAK